MMLIRYLFEYGNEFNDKVVLSSSKIFTFKIYKSVSILMNSLMYGSSLFILNWKSFFFK